ncbi:MAG TPA: archaemetzincin [Chitinophagaceae bacterium]|nr:archaemetzincin [Chitinophagaceae bacterium]
MKKVYLILFCLITESCQDAYFSRISKNDIGKEKPKEGEWLYEHHENGQTFREFQRSKHIIPDSNKNTIILQPIGTFTKSQLNLINLTNEYLHYFFQLTIKTEATFNDSAIPQHSKRIGSANNEQLFAPYILDSILRNRYKNCLLVMAITEKDLYHKKDWNYVFGLASLQNRVGVTSLYRFETNVKSDSNKLELLRLIKTSSHEIGHMFGIHHCTYAACVMNASNSLEELDKTTVRLCSQCQRKIYSSINYDSEKRLKELILNVYP